MSKSFFTLALLCLLLNANEDKNTLVPNYYFVNNSINYLDWSSSTEKNTAQEDFAYLELEGGAGWDWGQFYGFIDIENPSSSYDDEPAKNLRIVLKPILDIYIKNNFAFHIQTFYLNSKSFYVNSLVTGVSYLYTTDFGLWFTPFIGAHYQSSTYYSGFNGYTFGWSFNYDFTISSQSFYIFNWHEIEFSRAKEGYELEDATPIGDGKSYGTNGALSVWWKINQHIHTGLQYRYAKYKLGSSAYQSGIIYTAKYYY